MRFWNCGAALAMVGLKGKEDCSLRLQWLNHKDAETQRCRKKKKLFAGLAIVGLKGKEGKKERRIVRFACNG